MALLAKCLALSLSAVLLSLLCGDASAMALPPPEDVSAMALPPPEDVSAMGLPPPQAPVNFSIGVQGMVWCKSCKYSGYYAPMDASPLQGAAVELRCRHGPRRTKSVKGVSGQGGYFLIESSQVAAFTINECKMYVLTSPSRACRVAVPGYPGAGKGLPLKFERFLKRGDGLRALYSVGNFFFQPKYANKCY